jgi:hypothetical protein
MCKTDLKQYRTITGEPRRMAMRAHLTTAHGLRFGLSHEDLTRDQRAALEEMAKAVSWRKGISCRLTLAAAFYVYLSRGVSTTSSAPTRTPTRAAPGSRQAFVFGRGHA